MGHRVVGLYLGLCCLLLGQTISKRNEPNNDAHDVLIKLLELELRDAERQTSKDDDKALKGKVEVSSPVSPEVFLKEVNEKLREWYNKEAITSWNYNTNLTDENMQKLSDAGTAFSQWKTGKIVLAREMLKNTGSLTPDQKRQLKFFTKSSNPSRVEDVRKLSDLESRMTALYSKAHICKGKVKDKCMSIEPDLNTLMSTSRDPKELLWAWDNWRRVTGPVIRPLYTEFVERLNGGAKENGYKDYGDFWRNKQFDDTPKLEEICDKLWLKVKPLYTQLHAYVRRKLTTTYGKEIMGTMGTIPAHLLGNMWAQNWQHISDIVLPKSNGVNLDITKAAEKNLKEGYNVTGMFHLSENFYTSIGLFPMTETFWSKSMLVKPKDRDVVCHASASDMYADNDFRIKMCTEVAMSQLYTVHHEMGHVQYFMAYSHQPTVFREGANSGFHEAVGDAMALSVITRSHLHKIKLLDKHSKADEASSAEDIPDLLSIALQKVAFLPYGYMLDKWRWRVMDGSIPNTQLNKEYWKLRLKYQGLVSPLPRSEKDFDPAAKFHISSNSPYMCYFISFMAQFQMYKSMCDTSGHKGPLHKCDFYQSKEAGKKLKDMLKLGSSKPWPQAFFQLTGTHDISAEPILEYFKPLMTWLEKENGDEKLGWKGAEINWKK